MVLLIWNPTLFLEERMTPRVKEELKEENEDESDEDEEEEEDGELEEA